MTREELIKIYSSYLPYGLKAQYSNGDIITIIGVNTETLQVNSDYTHYGYCYIRIEDVKPVLWDLSYLTKEIEHNGKLIIPIIELYKKANGKARYGELNSGIEKTDYGQSYNFHVFEDGNHVFKFSTYTNGYGTFCLDNLMITNGYTLYQELLKLHFNFFNLPKTEFINKATLNK